MMKTHNISLSSGSVIATALLLGASPGFAQSAETLVSPFPEVAAPAPLPEASPTSTTASPVMISSPVVQPIPESENEPVVEEAADATATAAAPAAATATARTSTPRQATTAPVAAAPAPAPDLAPDPVEVVPIDVTEPAAVVEEPVAPVGNDELVRDLWPIALGGLAVLGLAIWGFVAIGRRKPVQRRVETVARPAPRPIERPSQPVLAASPAVAEPVPMPPASSELVATWSRPAARFPSAGMAHSGAGVSLPRSVPATFEERDALLKRMVAAKPDRANPFVGYKARMKRARLILQSLGRDFSETEPWIDLGQYSANWPELSRNKTAAA